MALVAAGASMSGCTAIRRNLAPVTPDEFRVVSRAPLVVPPDYALRPPAPGEPFPVTYEALPSLERTIRSRAIERPEDSYTIKLLDDPKLIGEKIEEEAEEVVRAGREETDARVAEEAADLLYHLSVLLFSRGVSQADVMEVLNARSG